YFDAKATDSNSDPYWLIICKTAVMPTANVSAAPTCNGGVANQWAVSAMIVAGSLATTSTTTIATAPFASENNDWYGWVCDGNITLPKCNPLYKNGEPNDGNYPGSSSPF